MRPERGKPIDGGALATLSHALASVSTPPAGAVGAPAAAALAASAPASMQTTASPGPAIKPWKAS